MSMNRQGRKTTPDSSTDDQASGHNTHSGNRGLQIEERVLFDLGDTQTTASICQNRPA